MATKRKTKTPTPAAAAPASDGPALKADGMVTVRLGGKSAVGALVVGRTRIERARPGRITRSDFERFQAEYDLIEE